MYPVVLRSRILLNIEIPSAILVIKPYPNIIPDGYIHTQRFLTEAEEYQHRLCRLHGPQPIGNTLTLTGQTPQILRIIQPATRTQTLPDSTANPVYHLLLENTRTRASQTVVLGALVLAEGARAAGFAAPVALCALDRQVVDWGVLQVPALGALVGGKHQQVEAEVWDDGHPTAQLAAAQQEVICAEFYIMKLCRRDWRSDLAREVSNQIGFISNIIFH